MKRLLTLAITAVLLLPASAIAKDVYVHGYFRSNGTYVAPHFRSAPDSSYNNNWSVSPNINPYTGQMGTRQPTWNDRPPASGFGSGYQSHGLQPYGYQQPRSNQGYGFGSGNNWGNQ